jgi:hypothetical protein
MTESEWQSCVEPQAMLAFLRNAGKLSERKARLIAAPTMRIPEPIPFTINPYLAFRAILVAVENCNKGLGRREIDSLVCRGLGTGIGKVSPSRRAMRMRAAYQVMTTPSRILSFRGIHEFHKALHLM